VRRTIIGLTERVFAGHTNGEFLAIRGGIGIR
jgi:hypothetical protein